MEDIRMIPKSKKGQTIGVGTVTSLAIGLFVLVLTAIAVFAGASALKNSSLFTSQSLEQNNTALLLNNLTGAVTTFGGNFATFFSILAIVLIIGFIALMIYVVRRFGGGGGGL